MKPIPKDAIPVANYIRDNVERPSSLPVSRQETRTMLRWTIEFKAYNNLKERCCPLGLLPNSYHPTPIHFGNFDGGVPLTERQLYEFFTWWDGIMEVDAQEAVNTIWNEINPEDSDG